MKKRILITGGAGFIGSHLATELTAAGDSVRVLDNFSSQVHGDARRDRTALPQGVEIIEGDVRSQKDLERALVGVDVVFHFAASVGVGQSMYEVRNYVDNNNLGTAGLLQALIRRPIEKLIVASSMSIYGEGLYIDSDGQSRPEVRRHISRLRSHKWEPIDDDGHELVPAPTPEFKRPDLASIYALSKFDQERMCLLVGQAYGIPTVALRFFNVYGNGQALSNPYTGVMAIFATRLLNGNPPMIYEDGGQRRDFVHVSDVARACRLALEAPEAAGHAFNIGSGVNHTITEIAGLLAQHLGKTHIKPEITDQYRVGDIRHCFADIGLARKILGYSPSVSLESGLKDYAGWLSNQRAVDRSREASQELGLRGLTL